ncbi:phosphopantetheine-binding protein [Paracoccus aurantiacus]|nr:phosphopantetheine-binding protein [Paracoccus aurantiacus]
MNAETDADWLHTRVAEITGEDGPIDPDEDLTLYGLDSMGVMRLVMLLEERGVMLEFDELLGQPTLNAWQALIRQRSN